MAVSDKVTLGGVTLNGPVSPTDTPILPMFVSDRTANHTRIVYQTTSTKTREWRMRFEHLTTAQKKALENYFTDTAKGPTNTFTYVHTDGESYTARFVDTGLNFVRLDDNTYTLIVTLELAGQQIDP